MAEKHHEVKKNRRGGQKTAKKKKDEHRVPTKEIEAIGHRIKTEYFDELPQFERLIIELSANFINLSFDCIDQKIEEGQKKVCEVFGLQRSLFMEYSLETCRLSTTHAWSAPGVSKLLPTDVTSEDVWFLPFSSEENKESKDVESTTNVFDRMISTLLNGRPFYFSDPDDLLKSKDTIVARYVGEVGLNSSLMVPLKVGENIIGFMSWESFGTRREWSKALVARLSLISEVFSNALSRKRSEEALRISMAETKALKDQLQAENLFLIDEIKFAQNHHPIIGESKVIRNVLRQVEKVAGTKSTVLILGETGTGKELVANAIHDTSSRRDRHMVKVNCASLPATLMESELFGHEKGAFTGALSRKMGRFELANGSTIFLDEVGELPLELQPKLLRVLQEGQFERVGGSQTITVDVRVIAATNKDLVSAVREGKFRSDLFYRLNIFPITVPSLRDRTEDIPILVKTFVKQFSDVMGKQIKTIPTRNLDALKHYDWPGNIRELKNLVERAMIMAKGGIIEIEVTEQINPELSAIDRLDNVQRQCIMQALEKTNGRVFGERGAARLLGLNPHTLISRMKRLGINRKKISYST